MGLRSAFKQDAQMLRNTREGNRGYKRLQRDSRRSNKDEVKDTKRRLKGERREKLSSFRKGQWKTWRKDAGNVGRSLVGRDLKESERAELINLLYNTLSE